MSQEDDFKENLSLIQQSIIALDKKIEVQGQRISQLERHSVVADSAVSSLGKITSSLTPPPPPPPSFSSNSSNISMQELWQEKNHNLEEFSTPSSTDVRKDSLEENIGGKWFARIGIAALILGISFFLKYAFDNDWIGETGRVMIGILIGLILLSIGEKTIRKYFLYGQIITGGGIAVLYLSIFSAYNFYHLIGSFAAFFIMIVITAVGIILSLRYDALSLMTVAIIGGFATPLMASSGVNNQLGLLSYLVLLDLSILTIALFKKWRSVNIVGFIGTAILFFAWGEEFYTKQDLGMTLFFLTLFFLIFSLSSLVYNIFKKEKSTGIEQLLTLATAVVYFSVSYGLLNDDWHSILGFFAMIMAIYYFIWAFVVRNITPEDESLYGFLAFLTVGFVTLAIPIQFKQNIITISWAIEAVILMIIGTKVSKAPLITFSSVVGLLAFLRFLMLDNMKYDEFTIAIFNGVFLTAIMLVGAFYGIAYVVNAFLDENLPGISIKKKLLIALFVVTANFVTIFSISREITQYYDRDIRSLYTTQNSSAQQSMGSLMGGNSSIAYEKIYQANREKIKSIRNKSSISLSIFWLVYSIILLVVGIFGKYKGVRIGGLALLMLAILKLFFFDLWSLGTLYRIISSISLGLVLLMTSFVYQRYKDSIKEII
jgi:uncharacterized membrane protein